MSDVRLYVGPCLHVSVTFILQMHVGQLTGADAFNMADCSVL